MWIAKDKVMMGHHISFCCLPYEKVEATVNNDKCGIIKEEHTHHQITTHCHLLLHAPDAKWGFIHACDFLGFFSFFLLLSPSSMSCPFIALIHALDAKSMKNRDQYKKTISMAQRLQVKIENLRQDRMNFNTCKAHALQQAIRICHSILIATWSLR